jgi:hypothetical protein
MTTPRRQRRSWGKLRQLRHGSNRWQASYMGPDLVRHTAPDTFTARMDAEYWLGAERRLIERDEWTSPKTRAAQHNAQAMTLSDYADRWIEQRTLKQGTAIEYRRILDRVVNPKLGLLPLRAVTADAVRTWHTGLGGGRLGMKHGLKHWTVPT